MALVGGLSFEPVPRFSVQPKLANDMWCRHCNQDVPAVATAMQGDLQCARCQKPLEKGAFATTVDDSGVGLDDRSRQRVDPVTELNSEESRRRMEQLRRSINSARRHAGAAKTTLRFDPPESLTTPRQPALEPQSHEPKPSASSSQGAQWAGWMLALIGSVGLGAGLGLMLWSQIETRPALWNWGLVATMGGQGLLVMGLVQLLASLWMGNRSATSKLTAVQSELRRLQRTTESLVGAKTSGAANFYADLARGSSPQTLIANLKSQVDALASRGGAE